MSYQPPPNQPPYGPPPGQPQPPYNQPQYGQPSNQFPNQPQLPYNQPLQPPYAQAYSAPPEYAPPRKGNPLKGIIVGAIFIVPTLVLLTMALFYVLNENNRLDQDARVRPQVVEGPATFSSEDEISDFDLTVASARGPVVVKLAEAMYYGLRDDAFALSPNPAVYMRFAYLPYTRQAVEAQIFEKQGGRLLAQFAERPDPQEGYKSALYDRYPLNNTVIVVVVAVIVLVEIFFGLILARRMARRST